MTETAIREIHYLEDSDDEVFLSRLLFETEKIDLKLIHHVSVESLEKAIAKSDGKEPALVAIDLNMPVMKGTEVIQHVLTKTMSDKLFMGICSGSEDPADQKNAIQVGARFFVHKPLDSRCLQHICSFCEELEYRIDDGMGTIICKGQ